MMMKDKLDQSCGVYISHFPLCFTSFNQRRVCQLKHKVYYLQGYITDAGRPPCSQRGQKTVLVFLFPA